MEDKKIKLLYPIKISKGDGKVETIEELTFSRIKTKHLKLLSGDFIENAKVGKVEMKELIPLLAAIANVKEDVFDEVDLEDFGLIVDEIKDFFGDFLTETGKK